jgi:hypothetical protein
MLYTNLVVCFIRLNLVVMYKKSKLQPLQGKQESNLLLLHSHIMMLYLMSLDLNDDIQGLQE